MKDATFSMNKDGNDMLHIARNPDGTLQPIVAARLPFGDLQLLKLLLQTERPGGRIYETSPTGGYFFAYDNTAKRPYSSVMIWKYSVIDGKIIIGDMWQEDLGIVRYLHFSVELEYPAPEGRADLDGHTSLAGTFIDPVHFRVLAELVIDDSNLVVSKAEGDFRLVSAEHFESLLDEGRNLLLRQLRFRADRMIHHVHVLHAVHTVDRDVLVLCTVAHPSYGIIVFEVKDGLISYSRERGWIQTNRKTNEESVIDPMQQAERSKYFFRDRLKAAFHDRCPYTLCSAVWFTSGDRNRIAGNLPMHYAEETVLWANDLENLTKIEQGIKRVFRYYDAALRAPSEEATKLVLDTLAPEFGSFQSLRSRYMATKEMFFRMTREQSFLLDYLEEQEVAAIHGTAGTGKTVIAVQKAQRLTSDGNVLFLCFNRFLKDYLAKTYPDDNIDYFNLEALYTKKVGKLLPSTPQKRDEDLLDFLLDWESYRWQYKHIVIDEGQDFKDEHLQALFEISKAMRGCFYVFYDRNQFVQGLKFPEWLDMIECRLVLSRNCRNTKEIAITSTRPIGIEKEKIKLRRDSLAIESAETLKPVLFFLKDKDELKLSILKLLQKYCKAGIDRQNIVILSCKNEGESALQESDFSLTPAYRLSRTRDEGTILFTTVRKFKGLEADAIICIDIGAETFQSEKAKNAFYVGTSRATTFLNLLTMERPEALAEAITGHQTKGPRSIGAVSSALCVKIGSSADVEA